MSRIRGLELQFNLEKGRNRLQSKQDCLVIALHCLMINDNFVCVGIGDEWPETDAVATELLPDNWNSNQDVYSLRYKSKDSQSRVLLKAALMEHMLMVDAVKNEDTVATMPIEINNYVSDEFSEYSSTYKNLESFVESFRKKIIDGFEQPKKIKKKSPPVIGKPVPPNPHQPRIFPEFEDTSDPFRPPRPHPRIDDTDFNPLMERPRFPRVGGSDLDPFSGGGGMFMDPSSFGVPLRPTLPQFGVGGPGGLPRGAVPPGARFDPFMPPIRSDRQRDPRRDPDHPDFDNYFM